LRYYEGVGLVARSPDASSGHRRYRDEDLDRCSTGLLRAMGVGIEDMRTYRQRVRGQGRRVTGPALLMPAIEAEIETLRTIWTIASEGACGRATEVMPTRRRGESAVADMDSAPRRGGAAMSPVLVPAGPAYVGTQLTAALLRDGRVRATVRSLEREASACAVRRGDADDSALEVVRAD